MAEDKKPSVPFSAPVSRSVPSGNPPDIRISKEANRPTEEPVVFGVSKDGTSDALSKLAASASAGRAAYDAAQRDAQYSGRPIRQAIERASRTVDERERVAAENEKSSREGALHSHDDPPAQGFLSYLDRGVFGLCELLGLLFGLPFGDDLITTGPLLVGITFISSLALYSRRGVPCSR